MSQDLTSYEKAIELLRTLGPDFQKQFESLAQETTGKFKRSLYEMFWKSNQAKNRDTLMQILKHSENRRMIVSFNDKTERFTIAISYVPLSEIEDKIAEKKNGKKEKE